MSKRPNFVGFPRDDAVLDKVEEMLNELQQLRVSFRDLEEREARLRNAFEALQDQEKELRSFQAVVVEGNKCLREQIGVYLGKLRRAAEIQSATEKTVEVLASRLQQDPDAQLATTREIIALVYNDKLQ